MREVEGYAAYVILTAVAAFALICMSGCGMMTSERIPGLFANQPPDNCTYVYEAIGSSTPLCHCLLGAKTMDGGPALVIFEVEEEPCLKQALEPKD